MRFLFAILFILAIAYSNVSNAMQLYLRSVDRKTLTVEVSDESTVSEVVSAAENYIREDLRKNLSGYKVVLVVSGKPLEIDDVPPKPWEKMESVHFVILNKDTREQKFIKDLPDLPSEEDAEEGAAGSGGGVAADEEENAEEGAAGSGGVVAAAEEDLPVLASGPVGRRVDQDE
jgi:hypothetical protein